MTSRHIVSPPFRLTDACVSAVCLLAFHDDDCDDGDGDCAIDRPSSYWNSVRKDLYRGIINRVTAAVADLPTIQLKTERQESGARYAVSARHVRACRDLESLDFGFSTKRVGKKIKGRQ